MATPFASVKAPGAMVVILPAEAVPKTVPAPSPAVVVYWKLLELDAVTTNVPLYPAGVTPATVAALFTPGFSVLVMVTVVLASLAAVIAALLTPFWKYMFAPVQSALSRPGSVEVAKLSCGP